MSPRTGRKAAFWLLPWLLWSAGFALAQQPGRVVTLDIRGPITAVTADRVEASLRVAIGEPFPAGVLIFLDSPGGDGFAAMRIGRLARAHHAHAFVRGVCESACVFVLAGSVLRTAGEYRVAIHRGRLIIRAPGRGPIDAEASSNPRARAFLERAERAARAFLEEMGMPAALYAAMDAVPASTVRWLSRDEAVGFGLEGFEPAYLKRRSAEAAHRYGITERDFENRSREIGSLCAGAVGKSDRFIRCYRSVLQTGTPGR